MALLPEFFPGLSGFEWDEGNAEKIRRRHRVTPIEAEQALLNRPVVVRGDPDHSALESRYYSLGRTDAGRALIIVFTIRGPLVRVISARPMSRKERRLYDQTKRA